jgi:hypothetical protein
MHQFKKLVDIRKVYEQVPTLRVGFIGRLRATSLRMFTDRMCRFHNLGKTVVTKNKNSLRGWKFVAISDVERARLFLMDGGMDFGSQYPFCPRCQHSYFDGPPDNSNVDELNS